MNHHRTLLALALAAALAGCALPARPAPQPAPAADAAPTPAAQTATPRAIPSPTFPPPFPTATPPRTPEPQAGRYTNPELGVALEYPESWDSEQGEGNVAVWIMPESREVVAVLFTGAMPAGATLEEAAREVRDGTTSNLSDVVSIAERGAKLHDGRQAWVSEYTATLASGDPTRVFLTTAARGKRLFTLMAYGWPESVADMRATLGDIAASMALSAPLRFGVPEDEALFLLGGESSSPRAYDPAHGGGDDYVFSGLVSLSPQLQVTPDLAESWDVSPDGTVYTFHLRPQARFHSGRPLTAHDVIYSWERAADPATDSDSVLTYLGDIVGVRERRAGEAASIAGLAALDDHTLQVTIDAPKPYFIMKLTFRTAFVVDRANVESGPEWFRTPSGSGPYRLTRWERDTVQVYERFDGFYLDPPKIRYIIVQLYAGSGLRLYETGDIDMTGIGWYDLDRARDPAGPWPGQLVESVNMCTSFVALDATRPPFDDPLVRRAFALAVDRERYVTAVLRESGMAARGLYPPGLPGYSLDATGQRFDPEEARRLLAASSYGGAAGLPPIVYTSSGFGSHVSAGIAMLSAMWQEHLGVTITIENLEPNRWLESIHDGRHGQLFSYGWCADYPDPENFADVLFHSEAQANLGGYASPELDAILERARVEPDVARRMGLYQEAERLIVDDAAAIFLSHGLSHELVQPRVRGYVPTPIRVPIERYMSLAPAEE